MTVGAEAYYKEVYLGLVEEVLNDIEMNDSKPEHEQIGVIQKNSFDELCQYARDKYGEETSTFYANAKLITAEKYKSLPEGEKNNKMFEIMYKVSGAVTNILTLMEIRSKEAVMLDFVAECYNEHDLQHYYYA